MKDLIDKINSTFLERTFSVSAQREIWIDLAAQFRPEIGQYRSARPTTIITRETGDLGLAVLWIVQSMLIRPILKDITFNANITGKISELLSGISNCSLCALANSESSENPVVYTENNGSIIFNGEKKFITAGVNADLIIVTCRKPGEEKVSGVALIGTNTLPAGALTELDLNIFRSVNHAKLLLNEFTAESGIIPEADPAAIRRSLKKWGIIERALIMESFISFMIYSNRLFTEKNILVVQEDELVELLGLQSESVNRQLEEAVYGNRVDTKNSDADRVLSAASKLKEKFQAFPERFSEEDRIKLSDLSLFDSLKG